MWRKIWLELEPALESRLTWICTCLLDSISLVIWVALQYGSDLIFNYFRQAGLSLIVAWGLQIIIAFGTLIPVAIHFQKDVRIMWNRSELEIAETKKGKRVSFRSLVEKEKHVQH